MGSNEVNLGPAIVMVGQPLWQLATAIEPQKKYVLYGTVGVFKPPWRLELQGGQKWYTCLLEPKHYQIYWHKLRCHEMAWVTWLEVLSHTGGHYPTMSVMNKNLHLLKRISCIVIAPFVFSSTWAAASPNNGQHCLSHKTHCQNIWKNCGVLHWHNSSQNPISTSKQSVFLTTWPNGATLRGQVNG